MTIVRQTPATWPVIMAVVLPLCGAMGCFACYQQFRLGAAATVPFLLVILAIALFPVWLSGMAKRHGWIS